MVFNIKALFKGTREVSGPSPAKKEGSNTYSEDNNGDRVSDFAVTAETFYDSDVLELMKGIREGTVQGDLSEVTIKSLDDVLPLPLAEMPELVVTINPTVAQDNACPAVERTMSMSDLTTLKLIGSGGSGRVYLVKDNVTSRYFALKVISKSERLPDSLESILTEQRVLLKLSESGKKCFVPFHASWHDEANFYMLMDYVPGKDLALELIRCRKLDQDRAKFYAAELVHTLSILQKEKVIHRDLKPGNILIQPDGHILLADFGLSKLFNHGDHLAGDKGVLPEETTRQITGTPYFMSPEMFRGEAYSYEADSWAVGVVLYKMLTGRLPFGNEARTWREMADSVANDPLVFAPQDNVDPVTRHFIQRVLSKKVKYRLSVNEMKRHHYFLGVNWDKVASQEMPAPYIPFNPPIPKNTSTILPITEGRRYEASDDPHPEFTFNSPLIQHGHQGTTTTGDHSESTAPIFTTASQYLWRLFSFDGSNDASISVRSPSNATRTPSSSLEIPTGGGNASGTDSSRSSSSSRHSTSIVNHFRSATLLTRTPSYSTLTYFDVPVRRPPPPSPPPSPPSTFDRLTGWLRRVVSSDSENKTSRGLRPFILRSDL